MSYTENAIPEIGTHLFGGRHVSNLDIKRALRLREQFHTDAVERDGVLYWTSNGHAVPPDIFEDAFCTPASSHLAGYTRQADEQISAYKKRMVNHVPSNEEMFEMRAAFGHGASVVNVVTGQEFKL